MNLNYYSGCLRHCQSETRGFIPGLLGDSRTSQHNLIRHTMEPDKTRGRLAPSSCDDKSKPRARLDSGLARPLGEVPACGFTVLNGRLTNEAGGVLFSSSAKISEEGVGILFTEVVQGLFTLNFVAPLFLLSTKPRVRAGDLKEYFLFFTYKYLPKKKEKI